MVVVAVPTGCTAGTPLEHTVAGSVTGGPGWETSVTVDADEVAQGWAAAGGTAVDLPDGHVALLLTSGAIRRPEVTSVRDRDGTWVVHVDSERLGDGCVEPAVVTVVSILVHVRTTVPPDDGRLDGSAHRGTC